MAAVARLAAIFTVLATSAGAQWQPFEAPVGPGPTVATGVPGEIVVTADRTTRGDVRNGGWNAAIADLAGVQRIVASPDAPGVLYAIAILQQPIWRSVDSGRTWHELKTPYVDSRPQGVAPGPFASGAVYAYSPGLAIPVFISSHDGGFSWSAHIGESDPRSQCLAENSAVGQVYAHPRDAAIVFAAMRCGLARSIDGGAHWQLVLPETNTFMRLSISPVAPERMYASFSGRSFVSADSGLSWSTTQPPPLAITTIPVLVADPQDARAVWGLGDDRFYRSQDSGMTWTEALAPHSGSASLIFPGPGEFVVGSARWDGSAWKEMDFVGGAPVALRSFAIGGRDHFVGSGPTVFTALPRQVAASFHERLAGGHWRSSSAGDAPSSLAVDAATGDVYSWTQSTVGFITYGTLVRHDASGASSRVGEVTFQYCVLLGARTSPAPQVALGCNGTLYYAGPSLESLGTPTMSFREEAPVEGSWSARGVLTVLTTQRIYQNEMVTAEWGGGGAPRSIAVHPENDHTIFASWDDGVRVSHDSGATWNAFGRGMAIEKAIVRASPDGLYASNDRGMFFCPAFDCAGASPLPESTLVELHNAMSDEYFLAGNRADVEFLLTRDSGWSLTGESLTGFTAALDGSTPLLRFVRTPGAGLTGHYFAVEGSAGASAAVAEREWIEEKSGATYFYSAPDGSCARGIPVYRSFHGSATTSRHRLTTSKDIHDAMVAKGWLDQGVAFCAR